MVVIIAIAMVILIGVVGLVIIGLRNPQLADQREINARLEEFNQRGEKVSLEKIELSQPFMERIIYPLARSFGSGHTFHPSKRASIHIQET